MTYNELRLERLYNGHCSSKALVLGRPKNGPEIAIKKRLERMTPDERMTWLGNLYQLWQEENHRELFRQAGDYYE